MGVDSDEQRELLTRCSAGDSVAFEPIVRAYRTRAYHYALSLLGNHEDALDLSQEAFVKAFRALPTFDLDRPFLPWFLRILRNRCLNYLSSRARRADRPGTAEGLTVLDLLPSGADDPARAARRRERAAQVRAAIQALSAEHREIVFLRHFEDLSYASIAEVLSLPIGTVMSRLFNARRQLAAVLKSFGDAE